MSGDRARINDADVQGQCPACGHPTLFLGEGGYVTCSLVECPDPEAVSKLLEQVSGKAVMALLNGDIGL